MSLIVKVGKTSDLPPKPANWPTCENFKKKNSLKISNLLESFKKLIQNIE
jgi:hypothetical protein